MTTVIEDILVGAKRAKRSQADNCSDCSEAVNSLAQKGLGLRIGVAGDETVM
jgi:hypothetical protein